MAALPARALGECYERLDTLLPGRLDKAASILEADLANINAVMHPPGMVCNAGWIEATSGAFGFYADGTRDAVSRVVETVDQERLALADALGVRASPFPALFHELGFTPGHAAPAPTVSEAIERSELIHPIQSPPTLDHRYLHEDIGWGLVPWMHLGAAAGRRLGTIGALVELASVLNAVDYPRTGLTLEGMGLADRSVDEMRRYVQ